ncbi:hypothetical protein B6N60_00373 [Richelia sinica FACHB-800]|uniref:Uncharacterized protein n=1 Tax=Richelia sinica FACHB-800 TaxID=1357546 RepID=A0A975T3S1_9NOST|nr:hypothetical protein B6N60_00373 [Richelia sinica FACHB-800]
MMGDRMKFLLIFSGNILILSKSELGRIALSLRQLKTKIR